MVALEKLSRFALIIKQFAAAICCFCAAESEKEMKLRVQPYARPYFSEDLRQRTLCFGREREETKISIFLS